MNAEAVYLYELTTDTLVYERNAHEERAAASLTKMMTGLFAGRERGGSFRALPSPGSWRPSLTESRPKTARTRT